jgi:hypothetical protein
LRKYRPAAAPIFRDRFVIDRHSPFQVRRQCQSLRTILVPPSPFADPGLSSDTYREPAEIVPLDATACSVTATEPAIRSFSPLSLSYGSDKLFAKPGQDHSPTRERAGNPRKVTG